MIFLAFKGFFSHGLCAPLAFTDLYLVFVEKNLSAMYFCLDFGELSKSTDVKLQILGKNKWCWLIRVLDFIIKVNFGCSLFFLVQSYLIGWKEFWKNKWLMAYILTLVVSLTDWIVSLSFFCKEVRTAFCRNNQELNCGEWQRRRTCKGRVSRVYVVYWRIKRGGWDGSLWSLIAG